MFVCGLRHESPFSSARDFLFAQILIFAACLQPDIGAGIVAANQMGWR